MATDSTNRGDGPARRLRDPSHGGVVRGIGVERQEGRSVVISVDYDLNGLLGKPNDLLRKNVRSWSTGHMHKWTHSGIAARLKSIARSGDGVVD